ncbi:Crp/Fnr family transcriptional regulator [Tabrizicola sp. TH137]|uniref:Crp/Fnr family transcriptional regulator n=1 Tax=Tabrizicola sp. TH137 TaxID=2067452 RepID=UPI000C7979DF|nr:Crp/Fnr family transcriptional regulator [Tabrizicola sp. TH137]PLL12636.1 Crp/Fnr family transcriptional regulator [Tabrizicola sp. TH137]
MTDDRTASDDRARATDPAASLASRLRAFPIFSALSPETRTALAQGMREERWPAGRLIFSRGDAGDQMFALTSGRIRLALSTPQGREIVLRRLGPGDILGEMALIDGEPRSADATAAEATTCLVLSRARFDSVASQRPDLGLAMARHLSAHLRRTNFQMESIALYDLQTRLVRFLLHSLAQMPDQTADQNADLRKGKGPVAPLRRLTLGLNQSDVAAILGASRPKISQAFQTLIALKAIRRDGDGWLCDMATLTTLSEGQDP